MSFARLAMPNSVVPLDAFAEEAGPLASWAAQSQPTNPAKYAEKDILYNLNQIKFMLNLCRAGLQITGQQLGPEAVDKVSAGAGVRVGLETVMAKFGFAKEAAPSGLREVAAALGWIEVDPDGT